jgi:hypothetical protein
MNRKPINKELGGEKARPQGTSGQAVDCGCQIATEKEINQSSTLFSTLSLQSAVAAAGM